MRLQLLPLVFFALACRTGIKPGTDLLLNDTAGLALDADGDGYDENEDCDDSNSLVHPGAAEICDGADNNCNGEIDEGVTSLFYADSDTDGFGDPSVIVEACEAPSGTVPIGNDCDDQNENTYPGAPEICDGLDNDCDGEIDDGLGGTWYPDTDGDGYGDGGASEVFCTEEEGFVDNDLDCDDGDAEINPDAAEICDDADNNCNGAIDEGLTTTFYTDGDGDGYGDRSTPVEACTQPSGAVLDDTDCDDAAGAVNPGAMEVCNRIDDNCDGVIDTDAADLGTFYADSDSDGYGDPSAATAACDTPSGYVSDGTDCDDAASAVNPGETEICNRIDDDCDGDIDDDDSSLDTSSLVTGYGDSDGDGYGDPGDTATTCTLPSGYVSDGTDCDDGDAAVNPGETEICNRIDDDCDGDIDDDDSDLDPSSGGTYYADDDLDGYGDSTDAVFSCEELSGYVSDDSDCDDGDADINPAATDECNGVDDDCSGYADDAGLCPCDVEYYGSDPYMFCDIAYSWTTAETYCDSYDYHLATIDDASEDRWIDTTADSYSTGKWWFGLNDISSEGSFVWSDGSTSSYTNWKSGEPNNAGGNEDCAQINRYTDGTWNDEPCSSGFFFICEAD